jgi:isopentenyldiphosphate isomerase
MPPADEIVDVIDDAGNTVGVVTRREMRVRKLPHRCTYVLVFNSRGELFIHLRTPTKDVFPGYWDICIGGVLTAGETFAMGVRREIQEELGIDTAARELFPFWYRGPESFAHGMVYRLDHDGPFQLQVEEIVRGEFVPITDVLERVNRDLFCPDGVMVLTEYLQSQSSARAAPRER